MTIGKGISALIVDTLSHTEDALAPKTEGKRLPLSSQRPRLVDNISLSVIYTHNQVFLVSG